MPFTSSHLFFTKEAYYYLEANANKGHQKTLSSQTSNAASSRKGWFFIGSHLIKEMLIRGAFGPGLKLRRSPGCQWGPQAPPQKNRRVWEVTQGGHRAREAGRKELRLQPHCCLRPAVRGRRKASHGGLLQFYTHRMGLCNRVEILGLSNFHCTNTTIKNVSQITGLVSPSGTCLCPQV